MEVQLMTMTGPAEAAVTQRETEPSGAGLSELQAVVAPIMPTFEYERPVLLTAASMKDLLRVQTTN